MREQARRDAQDILHRAPAAPDDTLQRARRDSELMVAEANRRRAVIETQIADLDGADGERMLSLPAGEPVTSGH